MTSVSSLAEQVNRCYRLTVEELKYLIDIVRYPRIAQTLLLLKYSPAGELFLGDLHLILDFWKPRSSTHKAIITKRMRPYIDTHKVQSLTELVAYSTVPNRLKPKVDAVLDLLLTFSPFFSASINRMNQLAAEGEIFPYSYEGKVRAMHRRAARAREKLAGKRDAKRCNQDVRR